MKKLLAGISIILFISLLFFIYRQWEKKTIVIGGGKFWTTSPDQSEMGSYGKVVNSLFSNDQYQNKGNGFLKEIELKEISPMKISSTIKEEIEQLNVDLSPLLQQGLDAKATAGGTIEKDVELMILRFRNQQVVVDSLNAYYQSLSDSAKIPLQQEDARIITAQVIAVSSQEVKNITGSVEAKFDWAGPGKGDAKINYSNGQSITLTKPQAIAYEMHMLCWKDGKIVDTEIDQYGDPDLKACQNSSKIFPGGKKQ